MQGTSFESSKLIRFHHCDPAGIIFYPQYFILFNELMEDWFTEGLGVQSSKHPSQTSAKGHLRQSAGVSVTVSLLSAADARGTGRGGVP